ncbi:MAG: hypothetical protein COA53_11595 [Rhodobacteraceae bacterium]|nr:MAG: hypothetical protein COA53_11595 [Paracoccaceae bacterium]
MQTTDISATARTAISTAPTQEAEAANDSDYQMFLALLTTEMKNQDPTKPMDSTEFVSQLASFSSVEQQTETNSKLDELIELFAAKPTESLTEWLDKEVRHEGTANFNGQPINVNVTAHSSADSARLVVRDESGTVTHSQPFDSNSGSVTWNGNTQETGTAPFGKYSFEVESYANGSLLESNPGSVFGLVTEVRLDRGNTILIFEDGTTLTAEEADAVRMPQS